MAACGKNSNVDTHSLNVAYFIKLSGYRQDNIKECVMKNTIKLFGIIALAAVIGFSFAACGGNNDDSSGDNNNDNNDDNNSGPTQLTVDSFSAGGNQALAIDKNGRLWVWGRNQLGQVGNGTTEDVNKPEQIGGMQAWDMVSSGGGNVLMAYDGHSAAVRIGGQLFAWGNHLGVALADYTSPVTAPVSIGSEYNWKSVSAGANFTLALKTDGTIWSWGDNANGRTGQGTTSGYTALPPTQVGTATNWKVISAKYSWAHAINEDGELWGWGSNSSSTLGDGSSTTRSAPVQIGTDTDWAFVTAGDYFTIAIKTDGTLWGWGSGSNGRLGQGNSTDQPTPVKINRP
jgi:alpha-tubulin suppressor-like RCC1 family protein